MLLVNFENTTYWPFYGWIFVIFTFQLSLTGKLSSLLHSGGLCLVDVIKHVITDFVVYWDVGCVLGGFRDILVICSHKEIISCNVWSNNFKIEWDDNMDLIKFNIFKFFIPKFLFSWNLWFDNEKKLFGM